MDGKSLYVANMKVNNILYLTDPAIRQKANIDFNKMTELATDLNIDSVYGYTNQIEKQAYSAGYSGILYPSSRKQGANAMVLFDGRYDPSQFNILINKPIKAK